jgi:hypothetical protein
MRVFDNAQVQTTVAVVRGDGARDLQSRTTHVVVGNEEPVAIVFRNTTEHEARYAATINLAGNNIRPEVKGSWGAMSGGAYGTGEGSIDITLAAGTTFDILLRPGSWVRLDCTMQWQAGAGTPNVTLAGYAAGTGNPEVTSLLHRAAPVTLPPSPPAIGTVTP